MVIAHQARLIFALAAISCLTATASVDAKTVKGCVIRVSAKCPGKDLSGANLSRLNLSKANLSGANLSGANLTGTTLTGATLTDVDLSRTTLTAVRSGSIKGTPKALPANWLLIKGYLVGRQANLTSADFSGASLSGANLASVTLTGAKLRNASLAGVRSGRINGTPSSLPTGWILTKRWVASGLDAGGFLLGPGANLAGADITITQVTDGGCGDCGWVGPNCKVVTLNLDRVNLEGADLSETNLLDCYGQRAVTLRNANLKGAKLVGTELGGIDLSGANLLGADITGASFVKTIWSCPPDYTDPSECATSSDYEAILTGTTMPDGTIHP